MGRITIDWNQFESQNKNPRKEFEDMTSLLFEEYYCAEDDTLHSNPNNPGVEVIPSLGKNGEKISFQSKYFQNDIRYSEIKESLKKAVAHYKGELDLIYLYCNKDVTTTCKHYKDCEKILGDAGISLIPVTGRTILNQVMRKAYIKEYYFGGVTLDETWFASITDRSKLGLGKRYNNNFNVITDTEESMELFCGFDCAYQRLNQKKERVIEQLRKTYFSSCKNIANDTLEIIKSFDEVSFSNIQQYETWEKALQPIEEVLAEKLESVDQQLLNEKLPNLEISKKETLYSVRSEIFKIQQLIKELYCTEKESKLINSQILLLNGEAGTGKTHCFCELALKLSGIEQGTLVLGTQFITDEPAEKQLLRYFDMETSSLEDLLEMLQCKGKLTQHPIVLFIDAMNESVSKKIWLPLIQRLQECLIKYSYVRFALSYRTGYEKMLFYPEDDSLEGYTCITKLQHRGFTNNTVSAIREFFDFYGITYSPEYYFYGEFQNPLFLQMYCDTFDGTCASVDIVEMFKRLIVHADAEIKQKLDLECVGLNLVEILLDEISSFMLTSHKYYITTSELYTLSFWASFGLENVKLRYISCLTSTGTLITYPFDTEEHYYMGYNLLQDYILAKHIIQSHNDYTMRSQYVREELLAIDHGKIGNFTGIDVYVFICALEQSEYGNESIAETLGLLESKESNDRNYLLEQYLKSFEWRVVTRDTADMLVELLKKYGIDYDLFLDVLVANSLKPTSALNAYYLHNLLSGMSITERDYLWTNYENEKDYEGVRTYELIELFERYKRIDIDEEKTKLLLLLLSWILTTSNRYLRDHCSKAIIVILEKHFSQCKWLLKQFEGVDDPYVIQRLYGCIYGATLRREDNMGKSFFELVTYIYHSVFLADEVYPDILLRDYACGIVARWVYENPKEKQYFDEAVYMPPYGSADLPVMEDLIAKYDDYESGSGYIVRSMKPDRIPDPGGYGDFGRYIFQAALSDFEGVDVKNAYLYAMNYIFNVLKYSNEYFGEVDRLKGYYQYSRHNSRKIERIGKKYQWIAFYNTLAHVADNYKLAYEGGNYSGAWKLYVRDFDPTVSHLMLEDPAAEKLFKPCSFESEFLDDFNASNDEIVEWADTCSRILEYNEFPLVITDQTGVEWVKLTQTHHEELSDSNNESDIYNRKRQIIWRYSFSYFVHSDDIVKISDSLKGVSFDNRWFPEGRRTITLFNREMFWSPAFHDEIGNEWISYEAETGETEEIVHERDSLYDLISGYSETDQIKASRTWTQVVKKKQAVCDILPTYIDYSWEGQYDASQDDTTSFSVPCTELVNKLNLCQLVYDGYFYHENQLVAFDARLGEKEDALLIRKDYLLQFLQKNDYQVFWTTLGEKQFLNYHDMQIWSTWSGMSHMSQDGEFEGTIWKTREAVKPGK